MLKFRNRMKQFFAKHGSEKVKLHFSLEARVRDAVVHNADLPIPFVRDCLIALDESKNGKILPFKFTQ
jgi:hypothetical protein